MFTSICCVARFCWTGIFPSVVSRFFKALFFMCAGVVTHARKDSQDIHFMGNLSFQISFTSVLLGVSKFALRRMPSLAGVVQGSLFWKWFCLVILKWLGSSFSLSLLV
jgi:NADH:ubiquinone oxidoreductase subunit 5 (subunit L)/multisubunit Na+/H+ antiporter MnhA subunit